MTRPELVDEFLDLFGDPEVVAAELEQAQRSGRFLSDSFDELLAKYNGQWVSVRDAVVIAAHERLDELLIVLDRDFPGARRNSLLQFITPDRTPLYLAKPEC